MSATLTDNNAKLENLEKSIRAANERKRKLVEKNKRITYDILSELYGLEGQELIDAVTAEHRLIQKLTANGMTYDQIEDLTDNNSANADNNEDDNAGYPALFFDNKRSSYEK